MDSVHVEQHITSKPFWVRLIIVAVSEHQSLQGIWLIEKELFFKGFIRLHSAVIFILSFPCNKTYKNVYH